MIKWLKLVVIAMLVILIIIVAIMFSTIKWENSLANQIEVESDEDLLFEEKRKTLEKVHEQWAHELEEARQKEQETADSDLNEQTSRIHNFYEDITVVTDPDSYLVLVNKNNVLSSDYVPTDLVAPSVLTRGHQPNYNQLLRAQAAEMLSQLFLAAHEEAGLILLARSGYRCYQTQSNLYQSYVRNYGEEHADWFSARPGHSEHQTGLAMDVTADSVGQQLIAELGDTAEGIWLAENSHRFGFIIRYPRGREMDTGYTYEPWHIRYVGIEAATEIYENDLILEEYLGRW